MKRTLIMSLAAVMAGIMLSMGCGTAVSIRQEEDILEPPPSDATSAGRLSGFEYSLGGEHYKTVHSLGSPFAETIQTSDNGTYQIK